MRVWSGTASPLSTTGDGKGVHGALFSAHALQVERCLCDALDAAQDRHGIALLAYADQVWHACLPEVRHGQRQGSRLHGLYALQQGYRCNPSMMGLDPYAKASGRAVRWAEALCSDRQGEPKAGPSYDARDAAVSVPLAAVLELALPWRTTAHRIRRGLRLSSTPATSRALPKGTPPPDASSPRRSWVTEWQAMGETEQLPLLLVNAQPATLLS